MIRVIATDLDGTLLNNNHRIALETMEVLKAARDAGYRIIVTTGRDLSGVEEVFEGEELTCDYILRNGSEVRNPGKEIVKEVPLSMEKCEEVYRTLEKYPVMAMYDIKNGGRCMIGTEEEIEQDLLEQLRLFHVGANLTDEEIRQSSFYRWQKKNLEVLADFEELKSLRETVCKISLNVTDVSTFQALRSELEKNPHIAVAAAFEKNLEITDVKAQKGPVLKEYIESLGYTMDEVIAFGDSGNDSSMLSMDFGATVAMANAMDEAKAAAKYMTKSNEELGVAYAICELMKRNGKLV